MKINNVLVFVGVMLLSGCLFVGGSAKETALGQYNEQTIKEKIIVGKSTKKDVLLVLGQPSTPKDYISKSEWDYYSSKTDKLIILLVSIINDKSQSLHVTFDANNVVTTLDYKEVK